MQKQRQNIPVMIMTGYHPDDFVASQLRDLKVDVVDMLRKPVRITALLNVINRLNRL